MWKCLKKSVTTKGFPGCPPPLATPMTLSLIIPWICGCVWLVAGSDSAFGGVFRGGWEWLGHRVAKSFMIGRAGLFPGWGFLSFRRKGWGQRAPANVIEGSELPLLENNQVSLFWEFPALLGKPPLCPSPSRPSASSPLDVPLWPAGAHTWVSIALLG